MDCRAHVSLRVVLVALIPIMILGCAHLAPELIAPPHATASAIMTVPSSTDVPPSFGPAEPDNDGTIDLYGNDVTDAVARYKLDAEGTLYELHSPQTQLPRLARPKA